MKPRALLLFGPTASGKTQLIQNIFPDRAEVISVDSMQVYRHLNIGTAKPEISLKETVPHHLVDIRDPKEPFTVAEFIFLTHKHISEIADRGKVPVLCGGTAFYFHTFIYGLSGAPGSNAKIRQSLYITLEKNGLEYLYNKLQSVDSVAAKNIAKKDTHRILRALEVFYVTGKPFSGFNNPKKPNDHYSLLIIGLERSRCELFERINLRVEQMFQQGLCEEVAGLIKAGYKESDPGMQGIGYREFFTWARYGCAGISGLKQAIKTNTRRYAKRQLVFFKALPNVHWIDPEDQKGISKKVSSFFNI